MDDDKWIALEHQLREHYIDALLRFGNAVSDAYDGEVPTIYITYTTDKNGRWAVRSYDPDLTTVGAELMLVIDAHADSAIKAQNLKVLRGYLPAPSNDDD